MASPWVRSDRDRDKLLSAVSALLVNLMIGYALLVGLKGPLSLPQLDEAPLSLFNLAPPAPKSRESAQRDKSKVKQPKGGGSPLLSPVPKSPDLPPRPAPIVAQPPVISLPTYPLPAAMPSGGADNGSGASGNGQGSGEGNGSGSGAGPGRGVGDSGKFSSARQIGGRFRNSDFPQSARGAGQLKIGVRYAVGPSGRVETCEIIEASGYAEVDAMTCRVIQERYRFQPARDPEGYAVTEVLEEDYRWRVR